MVGRWRNLPIRIVALEPTAILNLELVDDVRPGDSGCISFERPHDERP